MILNTIKLTVRSLGSVPIINTLKSESFHTIGSQRFTRWSHRRPALVVNEDELFDVAEEGTFAKPEVPKSTSRRGRSRKEHKYENEEPDKIEEEPEVKKVEAKKPKVKRIKIHKKYSSILKELHEVPDSTLIYTKLLENDKQLGTIMVNIKSRKVRQKNDQILVEGQRLIQDAIEAGAVPEMIIFSRINELQNITLPNNIKLYKVPYRSIQLWSTLTTPAGIMGIFKTPNLKKKVRDAVPLSIICDNVRDPGNLGAIIRAAAGVGCEQMYFTKGCVDVWEPKVLRSAAGAHFRIPIKNRQSWEDIFSEISSDAMVYIADNNAESDNTEENENDIEQDVENSEDVEIQEGDLVKDTKPSVRERKLRSQMILRNLYNLPVVPYYSVNFTNNQVILIIGGETKGISEEAFSLVQERQGIRVNVPLDNGMESLNTGMAMGIIAFEVKRQFAEMKATLKNL